LVALDGRVSIAYGPHVVGHYTAQGEPLPFSEKARAPRCGNDAPTTAVTIKIRQEKKNQNRTDHVL